MANIIEGYGSQFFPDQDVHAADLNNIQYASYYGLRQYLKKATKTPGIFMNARGTNDVSNTTGLHVSCNNIGTLLSIYPGGALDSEGRFINVPTAPTVVSGSTGADPLYYPARPSISLLTPGITGAGTYYINIYYAPLYGSQEPNDAGDQFYTRVYDSYRIAVETTQVTSPGITLARAVFDGSGVLETTSDSNGFLAGNGTRYSLFDMRTGYEIYDEQKTDNATEIANLKTAIFEEELEKSVAFVFPAPGHSAITKIHRNATIVRMELYVEVRTNDTGTVAFSFYSGSTANNWVTGPVTLSTSVGPTLNYSSVVGSSLNMAYFANDPIKFVLPVADDSVTRVTATIVYKRR